MSKGLEAFNEKVRLYSSFEEENEIIEKELKALEIITIKIGAKTILHEYGYLLNEEEYDLLKEVML